MSGNRSVGGFNFDDFLTRIIPGVVVVSPFLVGMIFTGISLPEIPLLDSLLLLAITGLLIGELIEFLRLTLFPVPAPFKHVLFHHTEDEDLLGFWGKADILFTRKLSGFGQLIPDRISEYLPQSGKGRRTIFANTKSDFQTEFETQFQLQFDKHTSYTIYSVFLSYMEPRMSIRTERHQTLRAFSHNLMIASVISLSTTSWIVYMNIRPIDNPLLVLSGLVLLIVLLLAIELALFLSSTAFPYVDLLISDYYVDRIESN